MGKFTCPKCKEDTLNVSLTWNSKSVIAKIHCLNCNKEFTARVEEEFLKQDIFSDPVKMIVYVDHILLNDKLFERFNLC